MSLQEKRRELHCAHAVHEGTNDAIDQCSVHEITAYEVAMNGSMAYYLNGNNDTIKLIIMRNVSAQKTIMCSCPHPLCIRMMHASP